MVISIQEMRKAEQQRQAEALRQQQLQAQQAVAFGSRSLREPERQGVLKFARFLYGS